MGQFCMLQLLTLPIYHVILTLLMEHVITAISGKTLCFKATFFTKAALNTTMGTMQPI